MKVESEKELKTTKGKEKERGRGEKGKTGKKK